MDAGVFVPLAVFTLVVLIVAITSMVKLHDKEMEVRHRLYTEELEHQRKMKELALELERVNQSLSLSAAQSKPRDTVTGRLTD
jgi:hypothetical protein